jgi:Ran GTPase-activating protein (RanGAP) involved in mRNA processing and transport
MESLSKNQSIFRIDVGSNSITDESSESIYSMLTLNRSLEFLDLSRNSLTGSFALKISEALSRNNTLLHLNVSGNEIGDEGVIGICESILRGASIKDISFSGISYTCKGCKSIGESLSKLAFVDLSEKRFSADEAHEIVKGLRQNSSLLGLKLDQCSFSNFGFSEILSAINEMSNLERLSLRRVNFTTIQRSLLFEALRLNKTIIELDFSGSQFSYDDLEDLCSSLKNNCVVQHLNLSHIRLQDLRIVDHFIELVHSSGSICSLSIDSSMKSSQASIESACKSNISRLKKTLRNTFFQIFEEKNRQKRNLLFDTKIFELILFPMAGI